MRVLQIVHGFPPEFIAGTERYCEALSQSLVKRRHECAILAGTDQSAPTATLATVEQDGLLVARYMRAAMRQRRWTEEYDPEADGLARHLLKLMRPDVVHLHHWQRLTNNLVAICNDLTIPVVVTLHDVWTSCPRIHRIRWDKEFCEEPLATAPCLTCADRGRWQGDPEIRNALALRREIMDTELALATTIIAPSEAHHTFLRKLLGLEGDRFIVLPHGSVPTIASRPRRRTSSHFPRRPLQIGHWGYLMHLKGTHLLLEAVRLLRDSSAVVLHLIGTPPDQEYECWLRELSEGITVRFHGAYVPEALLGFDLDLAIFPSITSESYSFTLDEAFRLRLPVIVSDRGALPERIGGTGLKFRAGDAADLAKQIQGILDSPELLSRMRRNIRPGNLVSMEAHIAMLEKIYEDAAHAKRLNTKLKRKSPTPYLKLVAHAQQQVIDREETLVGLQQQLASAQACVQEQDAAHAAEAQAQEAERARWQADLARLTEAHAAEAQAQEAERARWQADLARLTEAHAAEAQAQEAERARWRADLARLTEARAAEAQAQEAERARWQADLARLTEERAAETQARQAAEAQRAELEMRLAGLAQAQEAERARWRADLARLTEERAAETQARQAAEAQRAELVQGLSSLEKIRMTQVQELERMINGLNETRDELIKRLTELERTPAARLQALLQRWHRAKWGK